MPEKSVNPEDVFLTPAQAARMLNVSLSTLKKFVYAGAIPTLRTPGGHHRIRRSDLFSMRENKRIGGLSDIAPDEKISTIIEKTLALFEKRQRFLKFHALAVGAASVRVGRVFGLSDGQLDRLYLAGCLHDIGFLGIVEDILNKPRQLSNLERSIVRAHPLIGEEIAGSIVQLAGVGPIIRQHHERYDGSGYPDGLSRETTCIESRIIAVAEAFDAMTAPHSYRRAISREAALGELEKNAGTQFDPGIVFTFSRMWQAEEIEGRKKKTGATHLC
ncbi:MAG: helix-turn-helix domain-containing protein [Candidatus Omnitrophica bacterium]|nr:helix-turn-helix domain-containing protein [Candidatus Omnitrophota bacterium]